MDMTRVRPALFAAAVIALPATASAQWPSSPTVIIVNPSPAFGNYGGWGPDLAPGVAAAAWGGGCGADWDGGCGAGCGGGCGAGCGGGCGASWGWGGLGLAAGAVIGTALAAAPYYGGYYGYGYPYYGSGYGSGYYGYDSGYGGDGYGSGYGYPSYTAYGYSSPYDGHGYGYSPSYYRYASRPYSAYRHYYASARPVYRAHSAIGASSANRR
jgi:hypothetical protein